jgi:tetratricopeptide (TPR) repeat protein
MAAQQEALQGEVLSELLITDNDEVKAQYPDDIDDTGIRKGAIIHYGSRRGVVAHDPQDESVAVRFPGHEEAEVLPLHEVLLARPARKEAKKLEKAAKDLHDVICQSEPYKDYGDANKATLQQIRNGDAPPVWSVNDARHRSDLEWIAHICMKACAYRNLVSSLELHKQCWTSLEICVEPAITLFGRQAPEVVSLLLLQLYAFEDLYDLPNHKGLARHARRKCEDLMDVKLEGEVSLPWLSARDPSMRYTSELLRAEATQHLASATAAMGDPEGAIDIYERAIEQLTTLGDLGRLATCHHDCAGLLAVAALGEPGSQYRELRECANHALLPKQAKKLVQALKHACEALRAAELKYGRISTATAQMHYAVGRICRDGRLFSPAIHHLGQASLIYYEVWCGYARMKQHPDVATAVESLQEAIDNYQVRDPKCIDLPRELRDAIDPEASRCKCAQCDKVETDDVRFDRCSRCKVAKYCSRECQRQHFREHKHACKVCEPMALKIQEMREKEPDPSSYVPDGYAPKLQHKAELAREAQRRSEMVTPRRAEGELPTPDAEAAPMDVG